MIGHEYVVYYQKILDLTDFVIGRISARNKSKAMRLASYLTPAGFKLMKIQSTKRTPRWLLSLILKQDCIRRCDL